MKQKTVTLADLMRRMGVPFDINPFVSMYLNDMLKARGQKPRAMPPMGLPFIGGRR